MDGLSQWFDALVQWLVALVEHLGVIGIFIMTFLESTFMPIPSEMTMIPAGYLVQQGKMDLLSVLLASIVGTIGGAYFNYLIARHFGRGLFLRYGKYFLMTPEKLAKLEAFFAKHGAISTFIGRLIPGIRHYISFPAGLAQMSGRTFVTYTALGGTLWMSILITLGYYMGQNKELMMTYMPMVKVGIVLFVVALSGVYVWRNKKAAKRLLANQEGSSPDGK